MSNVFKVMVLKRHIIDATTQLKHECAIAKAIKESYDDLAWVSVDSRFIEFGSTADNLRYKYRTPRPAQKFIRDFDEERSPQPFRLVVTDDDLVSIRPRQMQQRETAEKTRKRRYVASQTGRMLRDVSMEDVKEYVATTGDNTIFDSFGMAREKPARVKTSRTATTGKPRSEAKKPKRDYARRPTIREVLMAAGEQY